MYDGFAPKYFEHIFQHCCRSKPSVLNKIYGMFEVITQKGSTYYVAMENIFYGMNGDLLTYDLKGSEKKRWNRKSGSKTFFDTNFRIDRNGEPMAINSPYFKKVSEAFKEDSEFLYQCGVVDYSLLLVIDNEKSILKMGIIDYLQQFNFVKSIENRFKKVINLGRDPTIVPADEYRDRF